MGCRQVQITERARVDVCVCMRLAGGRPLACALSLIGQDIRTCALLCLSLLSARASPSSPRVRLLMPSVRAPTLLLLLLLLQEVPSSAKELLHPGASDGRRGRGTRASNGTAGAGHHAMGGRLTGAGK